MKNLSKILAIAKMCVHKMAKIEKEVEFPVCHLISLYLI